MYQLQHLVLLAVQGLARKEKLRKKISKREQLQKIGILDVAKYDGACLTILHFIQPVSIGR